MAGMGYLMAASTLWMVLTVALLLSNASWLMVVGGIWLGGLLIFKGMAALFKRMSPADIFGPTISVNHRPALAKMLDKLNMTVMPVIRGEPTRVYILLAGVGYVLSGMPIVDRYATKKSKCWLELFNLISSLRGVSTITPDHQDLKRQQLIINAHGLLKSKKTQSAWFRSDTQNVGQWYFTFEIWRVLAQAAFTPYNVKHLTALDKEVLSAMVGLCALACIDRMSSPVWNNVQAQVLHTYPEHEAIIRRITYAGSLKLVPNLQAFLQHAILQMNRPSKNLGSNT